MTTPAGWYPDTQHSGSERYWDGSQWTDQSRPANQPPAVWATAPKRHTGRNIALAVLALFLLIGVISAATSGGGKNDTASVSTDPTTTQQATTPAAQSKKPAVRPAPAGLTFPGKKKNDRVVRPGTSVELSGWTMTAGALYKHSEPGFGAQLCGKVKLVNRDSKSQGYNSSAFKLQSPNGDEKDVTISGSNNDYGTGDLAPGGVKTGAICFDDPGLRGLYAMSWQPDTFSSDARGVWLTRL